MAGTKKVRLRRDPVKLIFVTLLTIIVLLFVWQVAHVLLVAFTGLLFGVLLSTMASAIERRTGLGRRWSLGIVVLGLVGLLVGLGFLITPQLEAQLSKISWHVSEPLERLETELSDHAWGRMVLQHAPVLQPTARPSPPSQNPGASLESLASEDMPPPAAAPGNSGAAKQSSPVDRGSVSDDFRSLVKVLMAVFSAFADLFFIVFLGGFLAAAPASYRSGLTRLFPKDRRERADRVFKELYRTLQGWLLGKLLAMTAVGTLTALGLYLLDMPLVLALALIAFLFEFVPIVGPWAASVPALLLAFTQGPTMVIWVTILYASVQLLESNFIFPLAEARTVHLPPALTLSALFIGGALFGLIGFLVATPITALLYVLVNSLYVQDVLGYDVDLNVTQEAPQEVQEGVHE